MLNLSNKSLGSFPEAISRLEFFFFINGNVVSPTRRTIGDAGRYFCYAGRTKPSTFIAHAFRSLVSLRVLEILFHRSAHQTINVSCVPRETDLIRVIRLQHHCFVHGAALLSSLYLSLILFLVDQSTIAALRGSGNVSEGTLRKLNPFIFSMFTLAKLLFSHGNDSQMARQGRK